MKIYTKTGDRGTTSLFGGKRVPKYDFQVNAYGALDEVSSILGWVVAEKLHKNDRVLITKVQNDLYKTMSALSGKKSIDLSSLSNTLDAVEKRIDELDVQLPTLRNFILPQGGEAAARFHIARSMVRRVERVIALLFSNKKYATVVSAKNRAMIAQYLNRLSDLLFMLARAYSNHEQKANL